MRMERDHAIERLKAHEAELKQLGVQDHASRILGQRADVMTRDSIHKVLRARIEASALRVF
jgi:predicted nucleotidyltransferase